MRSSPLSQVMFLSLSFSLSISLLRREWATSGGHRLDEDKKYGTISRVSPCSSAVSPFNSAFLTVVNAVIHVPYSYDSRARHTISFARLYLIYCCATRCSLSINRGTNLAPVILQAADYNAITHFP